jgi:hypothetical protein
MTLYIYAIAETANPVPLDQVAGVGEPPTRPRAIRAGELCAVVSEAPAELRAKRRDLLAHQEVLQQLAQRGAVLPMRFGMLAENEDVVRNELTEHRDAYRDKLRHLDQRVEFNVKVGRDEQAALAESLGSNQEVAELNRLTRAGGGTRENRVRLGELIASDLRERQELTAGQLLESIRPESEEHSVGAPVADAFFNVSFLVDRARAEEFAASLGKLAEGYGSTYDFRVSGPLPPYSFV